jgi:hypothetical protein
MEIKPVNYRHYRFGICMFMHKTSYYTISEEYKIYYGDTHLFDNNVISGKQNFVISACAVATKMKSTTKFFNEVVENDKKLFQSNSPIDAMMASVMQDIMKENKS